MINKEQVINFVEKETAGTGIFIVDINIKPGNVIDVFVDDIEGITIDKCVDISRKLEKHFDRQVEDFELNVSSPGLNMPFKKKQQYIKNRGQQVEVLWKDGIKDKGILLEAGDDSFRLEVKKKVKEGKKNKYVTEVKDVKYDDIKHTKIIVGL